MKAFKIICTGVFLTALLCLAGCSPAEQSPEPPAVTPSPTESAALPEEYREESEHSSMKLWINETEVPVEWENNETVAELISEVARGDITVSMSMYSNNEQVGPLGRAYTRSDTQTTTHNGDIVLYSGDQIVVFYGSNSWAYTRLGKMLLSEDDVTGLLANGDVTLRLTR